MKQLLEILHNRIDIASGGSTVSFDDGQKTKSAGQGPLHRNEDTGHDFEENGGPIVRAGNGEALVVAKHRAGGEAVVRYFEAPQRGQGSNPSDVELQPGQDVKLGSFTVNHRE